MKKVIAVKEKWTIPTYPVPAAEGMPMFAETRNHQGTTGNPYPNRVVQKVDRVHLADKEYDMVRLENDYIRVCMMPALGGRVFEAYDKVNDYHFLYRQHVVKPALIGAFGSWISGGMEFNWPFHHRPSTFMPVDYDIEECEDGSAICWMSECDPTDRTKGMVGIVLRPDTNYFETRVKVTNRTENLHQFLWWENAAVKVHPRYRLIFPQDVTWCHHHYDRSHTTFPIAQSQYGAERWDEPTDVSWHGNTKTANSYFAAPSAYDFFGGYDYDAECGTMHIADHHVSPGKKMFTWGYGRNADNWENALTDSDGVYCELMAGSYSDDQPDFTWIAPYETKCFSQFWYPTRNLRYATFANLNGAVSLDREENCVRLNVTKEIKNAVFTLTLAGKKVLKETVSLKPGESVIWNTALKAEKYTFTLTSEEGEELLAYTEITPDTVHIPHDNPGIPVPGQLKTAQDNYIAGLHIDLYRDPIFKPDVYYLEALKYEPEHLPSLIAMGEYCYRNGRADEAEEYLTKAMTVQNRYDYNPLDGSAGYLLGITKAYQRDYNKAYDILNKAAWSYNVISRSMTLIAGIDIARGDYHKALEHALKALDKESQNPIAGPYAAYAEAMLGRKEAAVARLDAILKADPLNQLARFMRMKIAGTIAKAFFDPHKMNSDPSQTVLDIAFDLENAGLYKMGAELLENLKKYRGASTMALYTLGMFYDMLGKEEKAAEARAEASADPYVKIFPYRLSEIRVLNAAVEKDPADGTAWYILGCILYGHRQFEKAAEAWLKAIKASPDFYIPYRNIAVAYYSHLGRKDEALPYIKKAVSLKPNEEQLMTETAYLMAALGVPGKERAAYIKKNMPAECGDDIVLELTRAYIAAGEYQKSLNVMKGHVFTPGEGGELSISDAYMSGRFGAGRRALADGDLNKALKYFRDAMKIPENLHASYWNESVTVPYRYFEAYTLSQMGREAEAKKIIDVISRFDNRGMWNMGGEFTYYAALVQRLAGDERGADKMMREAIISWEEQLADKTNVSANIPRYRFFYLSLINDPLTDKEAALYYQLGYGALYFGDKEKAKAYFKKSLELNPDNDKCALELELL